MPLNGPERLDYSVTQKSRLSPALLLMAHLKVKLQRQLHSAISARARDFSKVRRIVHRSTWRRPRRMVGQVVGLGAKLDPHSLDWMERLEQRKIDVHETGRAQIGNKTRHIAEREIAR